MEALQAKIRTLERLRALDRDKLQAHDALVTEVARLRVALCDAETGVATLRRRVEELCADVKRVEQDLALAELARDEFGAMLEVSRLDNELLEERLLDAEARVEMLRDEAAHDGAVRAGVTEAGQVERLKTALVALRDAKTCTEAELAKRIQALERDAVRFDDVQRRLDARSRRVEEVEAENAGLRAKLGALSASEPILATLRTALGEHARELARVCAANAALEAQRDASAELETLHEEHATVLLATLEERDAELDALRADARRLADALCACERELEKRAGGAGSEHRVLSLTHKLQQTALRLSAREMDLQLVRLALHEYRERVTVLRAVVGAQYDPEWSGLEVLWGVERIGAKVALVVGPKRWATHRAWVLEMVGSACVRVAYFVRVFAAWLRSTTRAEFVSVGRQVEVAALEAAVDGVLDGVKRECVDDDAVERVLGVERVLSSLVDEFVRGVSTASFALERLCAALAVYAAVLHRVSAKDEARVNAVQAVLSKTKKVVDEWDERGVCPEEDVGWIVEEARVFEAFIACAPVFDAMEWDGMTGLERLDVLKDRLRLLATSAVLARAVVEPPWTFHARVPAHDALVELSAQLSLTRVELRKREDELSEQRVCVAVLEQRVRDERALRETVRVLEDELAVKETEVRVERVVEARDGACVVGENRRLRKLFYSFSTPLVPLAPLSVNLSSHVNSMGAMGAMGRERLARVKRLEHDARMEAARVGLGDVRRRERVRVLEHRLQAL